MIWHQQALAVQIVPKVAMGQVLQALGLKNIAVMAV